jgi:predicted nucleotidyltransferase
VTPCTGVGFTAQAIPAACGIIALAADFNLEKSHNDRILQMAHQTLPGLLSLFAFAGMALSADAAQGSYVDVLTSFLRQAQSQVGSLLCEPARLEDLLGIKIDAPGQAEIWRKTYIVA